MFKDLGVVDDGRFGNRVGWIIVCFIIMLASLALTIVALVFVPSRSEQRILRACQTSIEYYEDLASVYDTLDTSIEEAELEATAISSLSVSDLK